MRAAARLAAAYLVLQAGAVAAWWAWMLAVPAARAWFTPLSTVATLPAFAPADALLFAALPLFTANALRRASPWAWPALCLHAGAATYGAIYCVSLTVLTGEALAGAVLMSAAAGIALTLAWKLRP